MVDFSRQRASTNIIDLRDGVVGSLAVRWVLSNNIDEYNRVIDTDGRSYEVNKVEGGGTCFIGIVPVLPNKAQVSIDDWLPTITAWQRNSLAEIVQVIAGNQPSSIYVITPFHERDFEITELLQSILNKYKR
jgi:hypothetical protein